jgi:hypothetical protein
MPLMPAYYTTTRNTPRKTKNKRNAKAQAEHDAWLKKMGVDLKPKKRYTKPLKIEAKRDTMTSDQIPGNGSKKEANKYTGNEIAGITLNHKQSYEPVRRDNKQAAIDSAQMRRN